MRRSELAGWTLAAAMVVVAVPGLAQHEEGPILLPKPKPQAATLLVTCDLACNWKLDGVAKGRIEAGGSAKVKVEFGQHLVAASTEDGLDKVEKELYIKAAGLTLARLELAPVHDARLKAEQEERDKTKPEGATLLVICDLACNWKLDGKERGHIAAGDSATSKVELGQHLVIATTEDGADQVKQLCEIKADGQTVVSIELKPVHDARLKAEHEARAPDPNDPASPHAPGIYLVVGTGAERKLVPLEPRQYATKTNGVFTVTIRAVVDGPEAYIKASNAQPEFYFYSNEGGASRNPVPLGADSATTDTMLSLFTVNNLGSAIRKPAVPRGANSPPTDLTLYHFTVNKEGKREALLGSSRVNDLDRDRVSFNYSRVGPAAYKVMLLAPLRPGEYGFFGMSGLFDFGVPGGQ